MTKDSDAPYTPSPELLASWALNDARRKKLNQQRKEREAKWAPPSNISVLGRLAAGRKEFPNKIEPTLTAYVRRCMKAGLVKPLSRERLQITSEGYVALVDYLVSNPGEFEFPTREYTAEVVDIYKPR